MHNIDCSSSVLSPAFLLLSELFIFPPLLVFKCCRTYSSFPCRVRIFSCLLALFLFFAHFPIGFVFFFLICRRHIATLDLNFMLTVHFISVSIYGLCHFVYNRVSQPLQLLTLWVRYFFIGETILCVVGCHTASLASIHQVPVAPL